MTQSSRAVVILPLQIPSAIPGKARVGCEVHAGAFVQFGHQVEKQSPSSLAIGQIAQFIQYRWVGVQEPCGLLSGLALLFVDPVIYSSVFTARWKYKPWQQSLFFNRWGRFLMKLPTSSMFSNTLKFVSISKSGKYRQCRCPLPSRDNAGLVVAAGKRKPFHIGESGPAGRLRP